MLSIGSAWPTITSDLRNANYVKIRHLGIIYIAIETSESTILKLNSNRNVGNKETQYNTNEQIVAGMSKLVASMASNITRPPGHGYLSEIRFWDQENMS